MNVTVRPLGPQDATLFTGYLSGLEFGHSPHWATCFCRYYFREGIAEEWQARSGDENRAEAESEIAAGRMKGYLAFDGDACIGWCNANALDDLPRLRESADRHAGGKRLGCTICFVIRPDRRGQGVARALLRTAVEDFRKAGYDGMLAFPFESPDAPQRRYRGTRSMFAELGYVAVATEGPVTTMRLLFG